MTTSEPTSSPSCDRKPNNIPKEETGVANTFYDFIEKYIEDALEGKKDDFALAVILKIPISCLNMMFDIPSKKAREDIKEIGLKKIQKRGRRYNRRPESSCDSTEKTTFESLKQSRLEQTSIQSPSPGATELTVNISDDSIVHKQAHDTCQANTHKRASSSSHRTESIRTSPGSSKEGTAEHEQDGMGRTGASMLGKKRPLSMAEIEASDSQKAKKVKTEELPSGNQEPYARYGQGEIPESLGDVLGEDAILELLPDLSCFNSEFS